MRLHPALDMSGVKTYRIILDGRDGNGFSWTRYGSYSILARAYKAGVAIRE
jgi:hypothetical protein